MNLVRKIITTVSVAALIFACNPATKTEPVEMPAEAIKAPISLPFVPSYSSSFEAGNADYATMIVQGSWKDWEDNNLDNMVNWVADTITAFHSNNQVTHGRDSIMVKWKRERAEYSTIKTILEAVIPVRSTDKNEDWVLVWATGIGTMSNGTSDTIAVMETWRINKQGKADLLLQYDRANRKK